MPRKDRQESKSAFQDARGSDIGQQVDHRSHKRRGITDVQPGIHVGYAAQGIEKRGGRSWRVALNRQIRQTNQRILAEIKAKAVATYRAFTKGLAQKLAADAIGPELTPATPTPAPKKQEPAPARQAAKLEPTSLAEMLPLMRPDKLGLTPAEPTLAAKPVLQWPLMRPDNLTGGPEPILAPKKQEPAPAPVLQPPQMRPDKLAEMPPPMMPDKLAGRAEPTIAAKKEQKPAPPPIEPKPQPAKPIENLALKVIDEVAEKKKKDGHGAAWLHNRGGGGLGG
jgi:hypothetical protein